MIIEYLELMDAIQIKNAATFSHQGWKHAGTANILLTHGGFFVPPITPAHTEFEPRQCYKNSYQVASLNDMKYYCEGVAIRPPLCFPFDHAWAASYRRRVLDVTWHESTDGVYFGIPLNLDYVDHHMTRTGQHGVLCADWRNDFIIHINGLSPDYMLWD